MVGATKSLEVKSSKFNSCFRLSHLVLSHLSIKDKGNHFKSGTYIVVLEVEYFKSYQRILLQPRERNLTLSHIAFIGSIFFEKVRYLTPMVH